MDWDTADSVADAFLLSIEELASMTGITYEQPVLRFAKEEKYHDKKEEVEMGVVEEVTDLMRNPITVHDDYCVIEAHMPEMPLDDIADCARMAAGIFLVNRFMKGMDESPFWYHINGDKTIEKLTKEQAENHAGRMLSHDQTLRMYCRAVYAASTFVTTYSAALVWRKITDALDDKTMLGLVHENMDEIERQHKQPMSRIVNISQQLANFATVSHGSRALREIQNMRPADFHGYLNSLYRELEKTKP